MLVIAGSVPIETLIDSHIAEEPVNSERICEAAVGAPEVSKIAESVPIETPIDSGITGESVNIEWICKEVADEAEAIIPTESILSKNLLVLFSTTLAVMLNHQRLRHPLILFLSNDL
jgi:hypothetical protein